MEAPKGTHEGIAMAPPVEETGKPDAVHEPAVGLLMRLLQVPRQRPPVWCIAGTL